jgi:DNA-binding protein HU-beta
MTKAALVEQMAMRAHLTKAQAMAALNAFLKTTSTSLKKGEKVKLVDFGTFSIAKRAERRGRHPRDGSDIIIKAKRVVTFKPGGPLTKHIK